MFHNQGSSLKMALKEVEVLKQLKHPNIIKYYDSFADDGHLYIVMEYASKGDLHAVIHSNILDAQEKKNKATVLFGT